jgi:hypothetical protein
MKCNGERRAHPLCLWKSLQTCLKKTLKILQLYAYAHDLWYFLYFLMCCSNGSLSVFIGCPCSPLGWIGNFFFPHYRLSFLLFSVPCTMSLSPVTIAWLVFDGSVGRPNFVKQPRGSIPKKKKKKPRSSIDYTVITLQLDKTTHLNLIDIKLQVCHDFVQTLAKIKVK